MCDNLSLYKTYIPPPTLVSSIESTSMPPQFYSMNNDDEQHQLYTGSKRKYSDYEDNTTSLTNLELVSTSFACNNSDDEEDEDDDEGSSGDDEIISDDESNNTDPMTRVTAPCTITQRRHSDTNHTSSPTLSYGTPIVKRRCTYSSMHDEEQKRSVLVESYRKLRGVKKPKLQVSLLICNLIKRLEKTFTKTPPPSRLQPQQQQQQQQVQYYQPRTTYRSSSTDSIYMPTSLSTSLGNDDIETTPINQQYSPPHTSSYDSDNVLLPVGDLRSTTSMYHPSSTDAYWLAQSNFAIPVVSTSDDDVDASLQGGGDYLDLTDNTLTSSFSSCSSSSPSVSSPSSPSPELLSPPSSSSSTISNDCCCSATTSPTITKLLVDTNNNNNDDDDYYVYHQQHQHHHHHHQHHQHPHHQHHHHHHHQHHNHQHHHHAQIHSNQDLHSHHHSSISEQAFFYHHNGNNTVDIITTA